MPCRRRVPTHPAQAVISGKSTLSPTWSSQGRTTCVVSAMGQLRLARECRFRSSALSASFGRFGCVSNGTARLLSNTHALRQARAAHRLAGCLFKIGKSHRIGIACGSSNSLKRPALSGAGVQWGKAAAPPPRRRISKGGIGRFGYLHCNGNALAVEGGTRLK